MSVSILVVEGSGNGTSERSSTEESLIESGIGVVAYINVYDVHVSWVGDGLVWLRVVVRARQVTDDGESH